MQTIQLEEPAQAQAGRTAPMLPGQPTQGKGLLRLMTRALGRVVRFETAEERGSRVYVAGTFNGWDPTAHPMAYCPEDGLFKASLRLPAGTHEYKFVVNDVWKMDDACPHWALSSRGTLNSVVKV